MAALCRGGLHPPSFSRWRAENTSHTSEDNLAATDSNLLLNQRIKEEADRKLLSTFDSNG